VGVVLSVGGVLGVGDKLVAVPWEQIDLIKSKGGKPTLYVTMSKEQLEAAPYFEPAKSDRQAPKFNQQTPKIHAPRLHRRLSSRQTGRRPVRSVCSDR
jgi:hypothetical protein